jgi:hypothetical protein
MSQTEDPKYFPELFEKPDMLPELKTAKEILQAKLQAQANRDAMPPAAGALSRMDEIRAAGVGLAYIQTPPGQRITPSPWLQKMCDDIQRDLGITSFGTYYGHDVSPEVSVDIFVPMVHNDDESSLGDRCANWIIKHGRRYGRRYLIWWQRLWNEQVLAAWRWMADRGSNTQNHKDHLHSTNDGPVDPAIYEGEEDMAELNEKDRNDLRYAVQAVNELKNFIATWDAEVPEGEEQSFWDGQIQMRNDLRHSLLVIEEFKNWFGEYDPQGQNDYWRGRAEVDRLLSLVAGQ